MMRVPLSRLPPYDIQTFTIRIIAGYNVVASCVIRMADSWLSK